MLRLLRSEACLVSIQVCQHANLGLRWTRGRQKQRRRRTKERALPSKQSKGARANGSAWDRPDLYTRPPFSFLRQGRRHIATIITPLQWFSNGGKVFSQAATRSVQPRTRPETPQGCSRIFETPYQPLHPENAWSRELLQAFDLRTLFQSRRVARTRRASISYHTKWIWMSQSPAR